MRFKNIFLLAPFFFLTIVSCKKNKFIEPETGIYRGVFSRIMDSDTVGTGVVYFAVNEKTHLFTLRGDTSSNAPYSCNGSYTVYQGEKISFKNSAFIAEVVSDPFYDPYYYLDTSYTFTYNDSTFKMELDFDNVIYKYNLTRF